MGKIIIEIFHTHRNRHDHKAFEADKIRVGRGYQNDLILPDPHVSAEHIQIQESGDGWVVEDLDSENGMFVKRYGKVLKKAHLESGDELVIGKTRLRLVSPLHPVAPAERLIITNKFFKKLSQPEYAWGMVFVLFLLYALDYHLGTSENLAIEKIAVTAVGVVVGVMVWAGLWAFAGRLIKHKAQFLFQLAIASMYFILLLPLDSISNYLGYYASSAIIGGICLAVLFGILFSILLALNLKIATNISRKKRIMASNLITVVILAIIALSYFANKSEFNPNPVYYSVLKPPIIKISPRRDVDQFLKDGQKVFEIKPEKK